MLRILLVVTVIVAVCALLVGAWRLSRPLFTVLLVAFVSAALGASYLVRQQQQASIDSIKPSQVAITIESVHPTASGVRLEGHLRNNGTQALAGVQARVAWRRCAGKPPECRLLGQVPLSLRQHTAAGTGSEFNTVVALPPDKVKPDDQWTAVVTATEGYQP